MTKKYTFFVSGKINFYMDELKVIAETEEEAIKMIKEKDLDECEILINKHVIENVKLLYEEDRDNDNEEEGII